MCAKLLGFLLFACQIIFNRSHVIREATDDIINGTPTVTPTSSNLPEGYVRFPDLHSAYKVYTEGATWVQARDRCIQEGAHLAIADNVEKIERIHAMPSRVDNWISVGIQKSNTTDDWVRIDNGLPVASIPWAAYNPDDTGDCVGLSFTGKSLVNFHCDFLTLWYACEISI